MTKRKIIVLAGLLFILIGLVAVWLTNSQSAPAITELAKNAPPAKNIFHKP